MKPPRMGPRYHRTSARLLLACLLAAVRMLSQPVGALAATGSTEVTIRGIPEPPTIMTMLAQTGTDGRAWALVLAGLAIAFLALCIVMASGRGGRREQT